jgi:hypothetical protein
MEDWTLRRRRRRRRSSSQSRRRRSSTRRRGTTKGRPGTMRMRWSGVMELLKDPHPHADIGLTSSFTLL